MTPIKLLLCLIGGLAVYGLSASPKISQTTHLGRVHFKIETETATYLYDPVAGGFSSIFDPSGTDWIAYGDPAKARYPEGAGYAYRGLPNFVHKGEDSGVGHPGFKKCESVVVTENQIRTLSLSKKWQWSWFFYSDHAEVVLEKVDPDREYWFLYEGPVAGHWDPASVRWGSNLGGPSSESFDYFKGETLIKHFDWLSFSSEAAGYTFWIAQEASDDALDFYSLLGNEAKGLQSKDGMVVAGFGRIDGAKPLLTGRHRFFIGMHPVAVVSEPAHEALSSRIEAIREGLGRVRE